MILETNIGSVSLGYIGGNMMCEFGRIAVEKEPAKKLTQQLSDYFNGKKVQRFTIETPISSPFKQQCWEACRNIPYGKTISYKELATLAGSPKAARAAGQAMRTNPIAILTPCHRVLSSSGQLHGYAGQTSPKSIELKRKHFLLELEQRTIRL